MSEEEASDALELATPVAVRSCRGGGGTWEFCTDANYPGELEAIRVLSRSDQDFRLLKREMKSHMERATQGRLTFGKKANVWQMREPHTLVLELRMDRRVEYPAGKQTIRLYFTEPASVPDVMLIALLAAKPTTEEGLARQDEHVHEANLRIYREFDHDEPSCCTQVQPGVTEPE